MRYGELISRSWDIFWRRRYLWLLGALGGGETVGGSFSVNSSYRFGRANDVLHSLVAILPLLLGLGVLLVVFLLAYFLVSCVATGALVRAAAEHDAERPFGLDLAWRIGLRTFAPILGLRLLFFVLGLMALALVVALALAVVAVGVFSARNNQVAAAIATFVLGGMLIVALIPFALAAGIVSQLAVRAIVLEQLRVWSAIGRAVELLARRMGRVLLVWLLNILLSLGVGLVLSVATALVALPLVAAGAIAYATGGLTSLLAVSAVLLVIFIVVAVLIGGAAGSYFSIYWTLAFRRLELDRPAPAGYAAYPPA